MPHDPASLDRPDRRIVSRALNHEAPWLDPEEPVSLRHVLRAAVRGGDPGAISSRLAELGYRVPSPEQLASVTDDDVKLISRDGDGAAPWIGDETTACLRGHVVSMAVRLERLPAGIAARLTELGVPAPAPDTFPAEVLLRGDEELIRDRNGSGRGHWIADDTPVPVVHVLETLRLKGRAAEHPRWVASEIVAAGERLARLGYQVAPGVAEFTSADAVLVSEGLDGREPWLTEQHEPVPLHHVLRFAQAHDRDPGEVVARLGRFGYRRLPEGPPAGSVTHVTRVTPEDVELLAYEWDGQRYRLAQDDPEWFAHVVAVGAGTGRAPAGIADRLRLLGYRIPAEQLPAEVSQDDLALISGRSLEGAGPWLSRTDPVPVGHVLHRAHARGTSTAPVLARLAELGYTRLPDVPDRSVSDDDLRLARARADDGAPVMADTVPYGRVMRAAADSGTGPREIADRYRELGYTDVVLPDGPLPESVAERDADLATTESGGQLALDEPVPVAHIVRRAHAEGAAPAGIARRLRALGFRDVPDGLPETAYAGDLALIGENASAGGRLRSTTGVTADDVRRAARDLRASPYDVATRLIALGYALEFTPHPDDAVIVSLNADGRAPWLQRAAPGHVLLAARLLDRTPEDIADRLRELGYGDWRLPDVGGFDEGDVILLSRETADHGPWLAWGETPSWRHALRAARRTGRGPQETGERLGRLGHDPRLPAAIDVDDEDLLEGMPREHGSYKNPLDTGEVLGMASRSGRSPAEVAARLAELGIEVPDLDYPTRRPAPAPSGPSRSVEAGSV